MSEDLKVCSICKTDENLERDDNIVFCTNCGLVLDEGTYQDEEKDLKNNSNDCCNIERHTKIMRQELFKKDFSSVSKNQGKQMLNHCINAFKFTKDMKVEVEVVYNKLINHNHFSYCKAKTKILLSGSCCYLVMNKFDFPITKNSIAKVLGCSVYELGSVYKRILKYTNIEKPKFFTIDKYVSDTVNSFSFEDNEKSKIENTVLELINLQRNCCLIDSNFSIYLIYAASFISWKYIDLKNRLSVQLKEFLNKFNLRCNLSRYVRNLVKFLIELCEFIPWVSKKTIITSKTVYFYINDLLEHPITIINDFKNSKSKLIDEEILKQKNKFKNLSTSQFKEYMNDNEISDEEINSYLRSTKEINLIKKIQKKLDY